MPSSYNELMQSGVEAAKAGQQNDAYKFFLEAIRLNPRDARGWLYLAHVSPTKEHKRKALETVLQLEPSNTKAQELLQTLLDSETPAQPVQTQMHVPAQAASSPQSRKRLIAYVALVIFAVIIVGVIVVVIVLTQSPSLADQKEILVRMCLLESEDASHTECEESADLLIQYFPEDINRCYGKYSDSIELFTRCLQEPVERMIKQSSALENYCLHVYYPNCSEPMCLDVPDGITVQCRDWSEDIMLNTRNNVDACWAAFSLTENDWSIWYMGAEVSDELDPFGKCVEENAKSIPSMN